MNERTIQPGDDDWKKLLGTEGRDLEAAAGQPAGQQSPLEQSVSTTPSAMPLPPNTARKADGYPLQLKLDVIDYLYRVFAGLAKKENMPLNLPETSAIRALAQGIKGLENPVAYANAKLLVDVLGVESFDITNQSVMISKGSIGIEEVYRIASSLVTNPVTAKNARDYVTMIFGQESVNSPFASYLMEAQPEEMIELDNIPLLLPHLQEAGFLNQFSETQMSGFPFNSAYFIVMEVQPPNARQLIAKTLASGYADGSIPVPPKQPFTTGTYRVYNFDDRSLNRPSEQASLIRVLARHELPATILQVEAQKLGIQDTKPHQTAYQDAWESLDKKLR